MSEQVRAEVAVVGAGPAGSLAALVLARAGRDVVLLDRACFPREKTCGDGLMPDALAALASAGVSDTVLVGARRFDTLRLHAPDGTAIPVAGQFAVLPREQLDTRLCEAAVAAGARLLAPVRVERALESDGRVVGAFGECPDRGPLAVRAEVTILATGANAKPLQAFGVCERSEPSATAVRLYVPVPDRRRLDPGCLSIFYQQSFCPGYGWVFPAPGDAFNIGVGYFYDARPHAARPNLRLLMQRFIDDTPLARAIVAAGGEPTPLRGAPIRTGLTGARLSRPGLLVVGEAAGLTYSISGEGIGKSMESGILAGELVDRGWRAGGLGQVHEQYAALLRQRYGARFRAYAAAQRWVAHPRLLNFLALRATRGTYVRRTIEGLVNETAEARDILSIAGILRSVFS